MVRKKYKVWRENDLWLVIVALVQKGLAGVQVRRAYQPTAQGGSSAPQVLLHRASSRRVGAQGKREEYEPESHTLYTVETWRKEDTYRMNALVPGTGNPDKRTAKDVLEELSGWLQSDNALAFLRSHGMGILRINEVTESPFENEQGHYQMSVSLDAVITYRQARITEIPAVTAVEWHTHRV